MKQTSASNLAIALALLAWPLTFYGAMSQIGDYASGTPRAIIVANHLRSVLVLSTGLLFFFGSLWLSGYSFSGAKKRSVVAAMVCLSPIVVIAIAGLWP